MAGFSYWREFYSVETIFICTLDKDRLWVVPASCPWWAMLLYALMKIFVNAYFHFFWIYFLEQNCCIMLYVYCWHMRNFHPVSRIALPVYIFEASHGVSNFSISFLTLIIMHFFVYNHSSWYEVESHFGFDLHFPSG